MSLKMEQELGVVRPQKGDVWNGYEWVSPERYERQRKTGLKMKDGKPLPPIQPVPGEPLLPGERILPAGYRLPLTDGEGHVIEMTDRDGLVRMHPSELSNEDNWLEQVDHEGPRPSLDESWANFPLDKPDTAPPGLTYEERFALHQGDPAHYAWRQGDPVNQLLAAAVAASELPGLGAGTGVAAPAPVAHGKPYSGKGGGGDHRATFRVPMTDFGPFSQQQNLETGARCLLTNIDPNPNREGLAETPARVAKAWAEWTSGYGKDPAAILKCFEDGAEGCDEMVIVKDIPFYSHCEHHMASIFGTATVAYLPNRRIVGLSKLPRLVDMFARRLQVQERMTNQIADALMEHLAPNGCGVVLKARHMCMESRGINMPGSVTITSALRGAFRHDATVRAEFLSLAR